MPSVTATTGVNAVAVGDWDRDGTLDVATAGSNGIGTFRGVPTGHLLSQSPVLIGRAYTALCAADLTNDGWLDLTGRLDGTAPGAPGTIDVHKNFGGSFSLATTLSTLELRGGTIAAADVNIDGKLDLIASGGSSGQQRLPEYELRRPAQRRQHHVRHAGGLCARGAPGKHQPDALVRDRRPRPQQRAGHRGADRRFGHRGPFGPRDSTRQDGHAPRGPFTPRSPIPTLSRSPI